MCTIILLNVQLIISLFYYYKYRKIEIYMLHFNLLTVSKLEIAVDF